MKTMQVTRFGGPEVMRLTEAPDPVAGPGQVLVDVEVADVLFLDAQLRTGWGAEWFGQAPPYVPGTGVVGRVRGDGRRVAAMVTGGYASQAVADTVVDIPDGVSMTEAAALVQTGPAALSLFEAARIKPGDQVLVTAAAGGLGSLLVQLAVQAGAEVTAAASKGHDVLRGLGGRAVSYEDVDGSFDVVFDGVGGEIGTAAFARTAGGGRFFGYGVPSGSFATTDPARSDVEVIGIEQVQFAPGEWAELLKKTFGRVKPVVGATFPLELAAEAHRAIEARATLGRTLLVVGRRAAYTDGVLRVEAAELPEPGPGQVRVRTVAAGVNGIDWKLGRNGPTGLEISGVVETAGGGFAVGQAVVGRVEGGVATYVTADAGDLVAKPDTLTFEQAAGLPVVLETALRTLRTLGLKRGQTLLIHAAAGGVGLAAAHIARSWGATVVGTASVANHAFLRERGVLPVTYGEGLEDQVRMLAPQGIDAVLDAAGSGVLGLSVELTGDPAKVVTIADFTGAAEHGVEFSRGGLAWREVFAELAPILPDLPLTIFPLHQAAEAHELSRTGHTRGKIVISIEESTLPQ
ncbi:zinc-binding dehydrogenase [Nonomuraea sp. NPDC050556]|uniref:zinc-binding dehydrogenase n=1 Tax=Nonomuraea sp. NPDC050556 TaxID=3364369 RepID=UPI00379417DB